MKRRPKFISTHLKWPPLLLDFVLEAARKSDHGEFSEYVRQAAREKAKHDLQAKRS